LFESYFKFKNKNIFRIVKINKIGIIKNLFVFKFDYFVIGLYLSREQIID